MNALVFLNNSEREKFRQGTRNPLRFTASEPSLFSPETGQGLVRPTPCFGKLFCRMGANRLHERLETTCFRDDIREGERHHRSSGVDDENLSGHVSTGLLECVVSRENLVRGVVAICVTAKTAASKFSIQKLKRSDSDLPTVRFKCVRRTAHTTKENPPDIRLFSTTTFLSGVAEG